MRIHFKYKLSFFISLIVVGVLCGVFLMLQADIQEDAMVRIKGQLAKTQDLVLDLLEEKGARLQGMATGVTRSQALHELAFSPNLAPDVRNGIVERQILPIYPRLDLFAVIGAAGENMGENPLGRRLRAVLVHTRAFKTARNGRPGQSFVYLERRCIQIAAVPVFSGTPPTGKPEAVVLVGVRWMREDLDTIEDLGQVRIALLHNGRRILLPGTPSNSMDRDADIEEAPLPSIGKLTGPTPTLARVHNERFVFLKVSDAAYSSPTFVIAKSFDKELAFVGEIRMDMITFGLVGVVLGIAVAFLFSARLSRPLQSLVEATRRIEAGDYLHRVPIQGRDEFSTLSLAFNRMVEGLQEKDYIQNTFGRYIDAEIAKELLLRKESIQSGGKKGNVPILMADIRDFASICEEQSPAATLRWLNAYFSKMIKVIKDNRGIIIDFVGDAILVFFDPFEGPLAEAVARALRCAFDMQRQAEIFNREVYAKQMPKVRIGIGINAGPVIIGNIGSEDRIKYGIVGSAVNITQRIQEHAGPGEIVVTKPVLENAGDRIEVHRCFETRLKGIKEPVALCAVIPADDASAQEPVADG